VLSSLSPLRRLVAGLERRTGSPVRQRLRQHQTWLKQAKVEEIVRLYKAGSSVRALADQFGVRRVTISGHLERHGVPRRVVQAKLSDRDIQRAGTLYREGLSLAAVAKNFDVDPKTVARAFQRTGITTRPGQGGPPRKAARPR
jgi:IS30 family transposase